jgi:hypothetical protein
MPAGDILVFCDSLGSWFKPHFTVHEFHIYPSEKGDVNIDGNVDVVDVTCLINYLFKGGEAPSCVNAADVNCDQEITIADAVYLINYIFRSGPAPQICDY